MVLNQSCALQQAKSFCNEICHKPTLARSTIHRERASSRKLHVSKRRHAQHFVAGKAHVRMKRSVVSVPAIDAARGGAIMLERTRCAPCAAPSQAAVAQGSGDLMPHRAFTARRGALLCTTALAGAMLFAALAAMPARADGGTGGLGAGGSGGTGGTTSATSAGGNGGTASLDAGGGGGGAGTTG